MLARVVEVVDLEDVVVPGEAEVDSEVGLVAVAVMVVHLVVGMEDQVDMVVEARVDMEAMEVDRVVLVVMEVDRLVVMEVDRVAVMVVDKVLVMGVDKVVDMVLNHLLVDKDMVNRLTVVMLVPSQDMVDSKVAMGNSLRLDTEVPLKLQVVAMAALKRLETILRQHRLAMVVLASMVNHMVSLLVLPLMELDPMTAQGMLPPLLMVQPPQLRLPTIQLVLDMVHLAMVLVALVDMEVVKVGVRTIVVL